MEQLAPASIPVQPCHDPHLTPLERFWELRGAANCGTFGLRGYRPISLGATVADGVNGTPTSPTAGHTGTTQAYTNNETRIQLSVRTKVAQGLLTGGSDELLDSVWFAYSQQSYWQLFNSELSRPFRATDHEPELIYILPLQAELPGGWRWAYAGVSANHQSNGQSLPLSRSWNRVIAMAGFELGQRWTVNVRAWQRLPEAAEDDDNPDIVDKVGRGEVSVLWNASNDNSVGLTVRPVFGSGDAGSVRLTWWHRIGQSTNPRSSLRFHTELFSGYGDSLVDYNHRRTALNFGLTLLDW
ncbi:phospholipase A [Curvibacter sp. APW13]|uniref:phospholipase A n=1 Tax=Curvibacter sp. APW13 TaxID=3077236 RepID=UPI0028DE31B9|nr:phospholipase A [Curvibacter sp. APW13]MDT8993080.1 phospholipase A [Curvibacter sp. APW13]